MPARAAAAPRLRRGGATRATALALLAVAALWSVSSLPGLAFSGDAGAVLVMHEALSEMKPLEAQVQAGKIVPKFGDKAQEIVTKYSSLAGNAAPELEMAIDGALQELFLRQASILGRQVAENFELGKAQADAANQADEMFLSAAQDLVRPGSGWSLEDERAQLRRRVEHGLRRGAALAEERARSAQVQQATIEVIGKLQDKMELLAAKVQSARGGGGSPWVLSSSYRIPNTPLQVVGRYEQGRANVELNLTPTKNPLNTDDSFVEGIGPANIGVSFNLGL